MGGNTYVAVQYDTKIRAATPNATFASFDTPVPSGSCCTHANIEHDIISLVEKWFCKRLTIAPRRREMGEMQKQLLENKRKRIPFVLFLVRVGWWVVVVVVVVAG